TPGTPARRGEQGRGRDRPYVEPHDPRERRREGRARSRSATRREEARRVRAGRAPKGRAALTEGRRLRLRPALQPPLRSDPSHDLASRRALIVLTAGRSMSGLELSLELPLIP